MPRCVVLVDRAGSGGLERRLDRAREALVFGGSAERAHVLVRPPFAALVLAHDHASPFLERSADVLVDVGLGPDPLSFAGYLDACDALLDAGGAAVVLDPPERWVGRRSLIRWRPSTGRLLVVTDSQGQAPLVHHRSAELDALASEPKAIAAASPTSLHLDADGLAELVELGQLLEKRTLFREVHVAAPGAILGFDPGTLRAATFASPAFSSGRGGDVERMAERLNASLGRVLDAYRRIVPRITVALSGGMDSRYLLAAARPLWPDVDAETFGESGSPDVALARAVAEAAGVPHVHRTPAPTFLADWAGYATWRSDGMLNGLHAQGMDAVIAGASRSRFLVNGAGGDVLMGAFLRAEHLLRPGDPVRAARFVADRAPGPSASRALKPEVLAAATTTPRASLESIMRRYPSERLGNVLLAFWLRHRCARVTALGLALEAPFVEHLTPLLDPPFVREAAALPLEARFLSRAHRRALLRLAPALTRVTWERVGLAPRWPWPALAAAKLGRRLGVLPRPRPAVDQSTHLRSTLRPWVEGLLLDRATLEDGWFLPDYLRGIVAEHMTERRDRTAEICMAATVELSRRIFFERTRVLAARPGSEPAAPVIPPRA